MFKLDLENAEEPEIKLPTSVGSYKKQENSRKTSALLTTPKPLTMWITTNCGKFLKRWEYQTPYLPPEKPVCRSRINSQNQTGNNGLVSKWERSTSRLYIVTLFNLYAEYLMQNAGWMKHKLERRLPWEMSITSDMQITPPLWKKVKRNSTASWWRWKRRVKKQA